MNWLISKRVNRFSNVTAALYTNNQMVNIMRDGKNVLVGISDCLARNYPDVCPFYAG
jgi:hypothetical protein